MTKIAVFAFGGNAILRAGEKGTQKEQEKNAVNAARMMSNIVKQGFELVIVHGNGPQVGNELIRVEESITKVPPCSLDYCVAKTEGEMGYMLETALFNRFRKVDIDKNVITLLTQVVVDKDDPDFKNPSKPVGPYYSRYRAHVLQKERKWPMKKIPGRGFRRLVPSPRPRGIMAIDAIEKLVLDGNAVISAGGGGIPVYMDDKRRLQGIDAVIDKDYSSSMLADRINADLFIILTDVSKVALNWGEEDQEDLDILTVDEARRYFDEGQFPLGSMGPKILASIDFVEKGEGREVLITSADALTKAMKGEDGTRIVRSAAGKPEVLPLD